MRPKAYFLYYNLCSFSFNFFLFLFLLVKKLLIIYNLTYWRIGIGRYFYQIEFLFFRNPECFFQTINTWIFNTLSNNSYLSGSNASIYCELRLPYSLPEITATSFNVWSCYGLVLLILVKQLVVIQLFVLRLLY